MIVSILIAFAIFGVLAAFYSGFTALEDVAAADRLMVVNKINFTQSLPIAYYDRVRAVQGVRQVTHANWFGGYYQDPKNVLVVFAVDPETYMDIFSRDFEISPEARAAVLLALLGGIPGLALAWAATVALRPSISNFMPGFALNGAIAAEGVILFVALGIVAGFIPGINAF